MTEKVDRGYTYIGNDEVLMMDQMRRGKANSDLKRQVFANLIKNILSLERWINNQLWIYPKRNGLYAGQIQRADGPENGNYNLVG